MVKRAVLIGVNYTGQSAPLRGCINDAHNVANFLIRNFSYAPENMLILTDDPNDHTSGHLPPFKHKEEDKNEEEDEDEEEEEEEDDEEEEEEKDKKGKKEKKDKGKKEKKDKGGKKDKKDGKKEGKKDKKAGKKDKKGKKKGKENKKELDDADLLYMEGTRGVEEITRGAPNFIRGPATKAKIMEAAHWLVTGASEGDNLFFHFSGHGVQVKDKSGDEEDGMDEAICPMDYKSAGVILDDDLHATMVANLPTGVRLTAILDCCHSGSGMDLPFFYQPTENPSKKMNKKTKKKKGKKEKNNEEEEEEKGGLVVMLSGCKDEQVSADVVLEGAATGAVSYSFISTMQKFGCKISYQDLLAEMKKVIAANVKSIIQCPMLSSNRANFDFGSNFAA